MIISAALCPAPPLLARELTGGDPVVPELRQACLEATVALVADEPDLIAVVGVAADTRIWPPGGRLDVSAYAPALGAGAGGGTEGCGTAGGGTAGGGTAGGTAGGGTGVPVAASESQLPLTLGLAARLLDQAGYTGRRELQSVSDLEPAGACMAIGARLAGASARVALLVMADGSARRGLKAPGYLDNRSLPFDAEVERAIRAADMSALLAIDPVLARELMATGRAAWQVLAGAMNRSRSISEIRYCEDPFGVAYLVASLRVGD